MGDHEGHHSWRTEVDVAQHRPRSYIIWLIVAAIGGLILVVLWSDKGGRHRVKHPDVVKLTPKTSSDDLSRNLEQIQAWHSNKQSVSQAVVRTPSNLRVLQREQAMRAHAPTAVYQKPVTIKSQRDGAIKGALGRGDSFASFMSQSDHFSHVEQAQRIPHPEWTVVAGELIPATLETAISSDLPGMVRAITRRPVYAFQGRRLLIPAGSRLLGQYASMTLQGINRVCVIWHRLILPTGVTVSIDSPSTDDLGQTGQTADSVDTHFKARFEQGLLISALGAGVATVGVHASDNDNSSSQLRTDVSSHLQQSAQASLSSRSAIKPTLSVHQGTAIQVFVAKDLSFYGVSDQ